jgi:hypothetical protein
MSWAATFFVVPAQFTSTSTCPNSVLHVRGDPERAAPDRFDLAGRSGDRIGTTGRRHHVGPGMGETVRDGPPQPGCPADDHRRASREIERIVIH